MQLNAGIAPRAIPRPSVRTERRTWGVSGRRAADCDLVDADCRLADADRHALTVLAAGADAGVELHVIPDHLHAGQRVRTVADQHSALDRWADLAVLDLVGLGAGEHEL